MGKINLDYDWKVVSNKVTKAGEGDFCYENVKTGERSDSFDRATEQRPDWNTNVTVVMPVDKMGYKLRNNKGELSELYDNYTIAQFGSICGVDELNTYYMIQKNGKTVYVPAGLDSMFECESALAAQTLFAYSQALLNLKKVYKLSQENDKEAKEVIALFANEGFKNAMLTELKSKAQRGKEMVNEEGLELYVKAQTQLIENCVKSAQEMKSGKSSERAPE